MASPKKSPAKKTKKRAAPRKQAKRAKPKVSPRPAVAKPVASTPAPAAPVDPPAPPSVVPPAPPPPPFDDDLTDLTRSHLHARAFLEAYVQTGVVITAAAAAGVDRRSHYRWMKDLPGYPDLFRAAQRDAAEVLLAEARRRAVDGLKRYRFTKDGDPLMHPETHQAYFEHEYSDTLLVSLLKAKLPEEFRERRSMELTGKDGKPVQVQEVFDLTGLTDEELDQLEATRAMLAAKKAKQA